MEVEDESDEEEETDNDNNNPGMLCYLSPLDLLNFTHNYCKKVWSRQNGNPVRFLDNSSINIHVYYIELKLCGY